MVTPTVTVGIDSVQVADVTTSVERFGARYLDRVFTAAEQADCTPGTLVGQRGLAARFAAKEAVLKALRPVDLAAPWTAIELRRGPGGAPDVRLHGAAARHAERTGVQDVSVSLSHDGDRAIAVAVAVRPTSSTNPAGEPPQ